MENKAQSNSHPPAEAKRSSLSMSCLVKISAASVASLFIACVYEFVTARFFQNDHESLSSHLTSVVLFTMTVATFTAVFCKFEQHTSKKVLETAAVFDALEVALPGIVCIFNAAGEVKRWNENFLGFTLEEVRQTGIASIVAPECLEAVRQAIQDALLSGSGKLEAVLVGKSGAKFPVYLLGVRVFIAKEPLILGIAIDMSEQVKASETIRLQSAALEAASNAIAITDASGKLEWVNRAFTLLTGYSSEEAVGKSTRILKSGRHDEGFYRNLWKTVLAGNVWEGEVTNRKKNGQEYIEEMTIAPVTSRTGEINNFIAIKRDMTSRKAIEEEMQLFRTLIDQSNDGIEVIDPRTFRYIDVNEKACLDLGYSRVELLRLSVPDVDPRFYEMQKEIEVQLKNGGSALFETIHRRKDGSTFAVEVALKMVSLAGGYIVSTARDISERNVTLEKLRDTETRLQLKNRIAKAFLTSSDNEVFNSVLSDLLLFLESPDGLIGYLDEHGDLQLLSVQGTMALGDIAHGMGRRFPRKKWNSKVLAALMNKELICSQDSAKVSPGQTAIGRYMFSPMKYRDQVVGLLAISNKPTEYDSRDKELLMRIGDYLGPLLHLRLERDEQESARRMAEADLIEAKQIAEAANQAKGDFLANMSHELRTPLNGVIGMTELALDTELTSVQRSYLSAVKSAGDTLLAVINDVLDFSKVEAGKIDIESIHFDLQDCVGEAMRALALRADQKGLELTFRIAPEVPQYLIGDPLRLRQILMNLVGNSIKFTERGEVFLQIEKNPIDGVLHCSIRDTGIGIAVKDQQKLFESFSQVDNTISRKYGGTGLGLAISMRLVKAMGGQIWVESVAGKGSTFHFVIPFKESSKRHSLQSGVEELAGLSVLIVDDNTTNRKLLTEITKGWGMKPVETSGALEALERLDKARKEGTRFHFVLTDSRMPELDGFDLAAEIKNQKDLTDAVVLMLSSEAYRGDGARCREMGISAYLVKPIRKAELLAALLEVRGFKKIEAPTPLVTRHTIRENSGKIKLLLAEDNKINQMLMLGLLESLGHHATVANSGLEALALTSTTDFDLAFMDIQMPEMDGFAATTEIRRLEQATGKHLPIIAMTAHALKGDRELCLEAGMDDYLSKPVSFDRVSEILAKFCIPLPAMKNMREQ